MPHFHAMSRRRRSTIVSLRLAVVALAGVCLGQLDAEPPVRARGLVPFPGDTDIRALACPLGFTGALPDELAVAGCLLSAEPLRLSQALRTVLVRSRHEHEGMYGVREDVALVTAGYHDTTVVAGLTQLEITVHDGESRMRMRRQSVVPSPLGPLLCVEHVFECGPGLFDVIDLGGRPYRPLVRTRRIEAFTVGWRAEEGMIGAFSEPRLVQRPSLDALCPRRGYAPFATPTTTARRTVQGDAPGTGRAPTGVCVDTAPSET